MVLGGAVASDRPKHPYRPGNSGNAPEPSRAPGRAAGRLTSTLILGPIAPSMTNFALALPRRRRRPRNWASHLTEFSHTIGLRKYRLAAERLAESVGRERNQWRNCEPGKHASALHYLPPAWLAIA
jgi:hypothetical protein